MSGFVCRGCKNHFLQDRICTTCAAQKLYDATVESQGAEIERLRAANKQLVDGIDTVTRRKQEEINDLREENEMLIVAVTMIERMAAGAIYSQEAIHASAIGALKQLRGKP